MAAWSSRLGGKGPDVIADHLCGLVTDFLGDHPLHY